MAGINIEKQICGYCGYTEKPEDNKEDGFCPECRGDNWIRHQDLEKKDTWDNLLTLIDKLRE